MHEGPLDLVVADSSVAENLLDAVRANYPRIEALKIVDTPERSALEIRRPFSGQALVERVLSIRPRAERTAAATSS